MAELHEAMRELINVAGRVSNELPMSEAEELSRAIDRATKALYSVAKVKLAWGAADDVAHEDGGGPDL